MWPEVREAGQPLETGVGRADSHTGASMSNLEVGSDTDFSSDSRMVIEQSSAVLSHPFCGVLLQEGQESQRYPRTKTHLSHVAFPRTRCGC